MERTDKNLREWADEHLVYEAQMLRYAATRLQQHGDRAGRDRNAMIESFAVHTRCLREFLWYPPSKDHPEDARAAHFCAPGAWDDGDMPPLIDKVKGRIGEEIVHLSYRRRGITEEAKGWNYGEIYQLIAAKLREFVEVALPERLAESTRRELGLTIGDGAATLGHDRGATIPAATAVTRPGPQPVPGEPGTIRVRSSEDSGR
jgi:hypothetical protein